VGQLIAIHLAAALLRAAPELPEHNQHQGFLVVEVVVEQRMLRLLAALVALAQQQAVVAVAAVAQQTA